MQTKGGGRSLGVEYGRRNIDWQVSKSLKHIRTNKRNSSMSLVTQANGF